LIRSRGRTFAVLVAAALAALAAGWALQRRTGARPDVVLITVDTLRADRLGCYGGAGAATPRIDALAASGILFENAACPMPMTRPSHFSMLTGLFPRQHGVVNNQGVLPESAFTVAEAFAQAGYTTSAFVGVKLLSAASGVGQGFAALDAPVGAARTADQVVTRAARWLRAAPEARRPFFLWVHLFDPHMPYAPPAGYAPPPAPGGATLEALSWPALTTLAEASGGHVPPAVLERGRALYDGEIAFADHWVGRLLDALDGRQGRPRAAVAFTADHGECFDHGLYFEHSDCLYDGAVRVPLIVRESRPGRAGQRMPGQVENRALAATLLALAGLPARPEIPGASLLVARAANAAAFFEHPVYDEGSIQNRTRRQQQVRYVAGQPTRPVRDALDERGVRTGRWKYLRLAHGEELYDVRADPGETRDQAAAEGAVRDHLRAATEAWARAQPRETPPAPLNDELRETLRSLGYLQ
jgi:arylsulfatase A-like enzyme